MGVLKGFLLLVLPLSMGLARQSPVAQPRFEVASIKPFQEQGALRNARGGLVTGGSCHGVDDPHPSSSVPLGRCIFTHESLTELILQAFPPTDALLTQDFASSNPNPSIWSLSTGIAAKIRIMPLDQWVTGGPSWADSEFFSIEAKAEDSPAPTVGQLRQMLQALVIERFKLAYHTAPKDVSGYFIVAAKGGPKLQKAPDTRPDPAAIAKRRDSIVKPFPLMLGNLDSLALIVTLDMHSPVVNRAGIAGNFNFTSLDGMDLGGPTSSESDAPGGSIFTAMEEKLGLKLEPHKIPVQIFVIDRAERPSDGGWKH